MIVFSPSSSPSLHDLQVHIRKICRNPSNVIFTHHARGRMRERGVDEPMLREVLTHGTLVGIPEPELLWSGLKCQMQRYVAGVEIKAIVSVEYPKSEVVVITVINLTRG